MYIQKGATLGSRPALIQVKVPSGYGVAQVRGFYRAIGGSSYTSALMQQQGNIFSLWVPASITANGIEYYMQAEDGSGNVLATLPEANPSSAPYSLPATSILQQGVNANARNAFELAIGLTFEIPAGALAQNTNLRVAAFASSPVVPSGITTTTVGYNFSMADGTTAFSKPITVTFNYAASDVSGLDASQLRVYYVDNGTLKLAGGTVNTTTQAINVAVNHFSDFVIAQGSVMSPAPVTQAQQGTAVTIQASVVNYVPVSSATLYYRVGAGSWKSLTMSKVGSTYQATIPAADVTTAGLAYYIQASDGSTTATFPATNPTTSPQAIAVASQTSTPTPTPTPTSAPAVTTGTINPGTGGGVTTTDGKFQIQFPANAVATTVTLTHTELRAPSQPLPSGRTALRGFTLEARTGSGQLVTQFQGSYTIVITYTDAELAAQGIVEANLTVAFWNGSTWVDMLPCAGCGVDTVNNRITIISNHFTEFAVMGSDQPPTYRLYLPFVARDASTSGRTLYLPLIERGAASSGNLPQPRPTPTRTPTATPTQTPTVTPRTLRR
jgi:hypothetical protein